MKIIRQFSTLLPSLRSTHSIYPQANTALIRVYPRYLHCSVGLSAPIQKRPPVGFARYVRDVYHEVSQLQEGLKVTQVMQLIANKWKTMPDDEKDKYNLAYEEDKKEWIRNYDDATDEERVAFKQQKKLKSEKRKKSKMAAKRRSDKDPRENYSKFNSLALFNYERYYTIRREFPALKQQDLYKLMIQEWRDLQPDLKKRYQDMAAAMRAKSKETMILYTFMELYDECYIPRPGESRYY